ncbi:MAG: hypothetical protein M1596_01425 [Firmicutes bacterium]|nr:hypothetical protein [Bacillota bacterium]
MDKNYYGVQMVKVGEGSVPGPEVFWMSHWDEWLPLCFQVGIVRGPRSCVLINTGPSDDLSPMNNHWATFLGNRAAMQRQDEWKIQNQLGRLAITPEEVTHVILTPLQLYTTSNIDKFPNAIICLSRKGWLHFNATHSHPHDDRWNSISLPIYRYLTEEAWDRVRLLEDEDEVVPGIRTWWAGTHHRASIAVEVDTTEGIVVLSDAFFYEENVSQNHPIGICENIYEAMSTYARVRRTGQRIVPLYDPKIFAKYLDGVIAKQP